MARVRPSIHLQAELWLPKEGNEPHEYEDALCVSGQGRDGALSAAVADGASESAFAREWACALVDAFEDGPPDPWGLTGDALERWLAPARERWREGVPWDRLPWHGEAKARAGAFATLVGLTVEADPAGTGLALWHALAVGDSCLFMVREGRLAVSFPLQRPSEFDSTPDLVCSNPASAATWAGVRLCGGRCEPGDTFILASDALACWFLESAAGGGMPWEDIAGLDPAGWEAWVGERRSAGLMRNDDTTLVVLGIEAV